MAKPKSFDWESLDQNQTLNEINDGFDNLTETQQMDFFRDFFEDHPLMAEEVYNMIEQIMSDQADPPDPKEKENG